MPGSADTEFLVTIGKRIRSAREQAGFSRSKLSRLSDVSPRYLAQLEAGGGNISILLLKRVAEALALSLSDLLADVASPQKAQRVCLIGLRGAGKSTLGQRVGELTSVPFLELNSEIEAQGGMAVSEIIALYGHDVYRRLEAEALDRIHRQYERLVLAVSGGIVAQRATYDLLLRQFHTVWIRASAQEHMDRVRLQGDERPMAGNPRAMADLRSILAEREVYYCQADEELDTSGETVDQSLQALVNIVRSKSFLL